MKILMVSSEIAPYAKAGGLGDVVGALSSELALRGHDVRVICPFYGLIVPKNDWVLHQKPLAVKLGAGKVEACEVWEVTLRDGALHLYFLKNDKYFAGNTIYHGNSNDGHQKNIERFVLLSRSGIDFCPYLDWFPDVIHCHDWMTGLVPVYLKTVEKENRIGAVPTVFTIHNMYHQGIFDRRILDFAGLPQTLFVPESLEFMGQVNLLKGGLLYSTKLTTVSERYATEIMETEMGCGLNSICRARKNDLTPILNGIDTADWNPKKDSYLPKNFDVNDMNGKKVCKSHLQDYFGLTKDPEVVLFGAIARLYPQKGLDLLVEIIPQLMEKGGALQIVILGAGDPVLEDAFKNLAIRYIGRMGVQIGYNDKLAHLIEAGLDYFIMPSRFEPCGLNQMYSMVYGSVPIVRRTGGLADTVIPYNPGGGGGDATGFAFDDISGKALYGAILEACDVYYNKKGDYRNMQVNGMKKDFSWAKSVRKYEELYELAIKAIFSR